MKILTLLFFSSVSYGALTPLSLDKELKAVKAINAFDVPAKTNLNSFSALTRVKIHEVRRNFNLCHEEGLKSLGGSEVKEWLALTILNCALQDTEKGALQKVVKALRAQKMGMGPWKNAWGEAWSVAHSKLYDDTDNIKDKRAILDSWLEFWDFLSKENQGRWYEAKGTVSLKLKRNDEALFFFKQSNDLFPQKSVQDQMQTLGKKDSPAPAISPLIPLFYKPEQERDDEIQSYIDKGDIIKAQKLMVEVLRDFPQGKNSKKYKERVIDIYVTQSGEVQEKALKNLLQADSIRMADWAQLLHRRLDYKASLALAEEALPALRTSPQATSLLWIAGRSAHSLGRYDDAIKYFNELIQKHSGTDEALEAQFRLGLIQYRLQNYLVAASIMERVRAFGKDKFELNSWYWQVRSLEKTGDPRAAVERDELIERFPLSYYGLRLRAEKQNGLISFDSKIDMPREPTTIYLLPNQLAAWKRFKTLVQNGWILEAQQEISILPLPVSVSGQWQWIQLLSKTGQYQAASILLNKLVESEGELRHPFFMNSVFPKDYSQWIEVEAKKYSLDPDLVRSLIRQESAFSLKAMSTSNALGLMQMIPPTAEEISRRLKMKVQIPADMYRPEVNIPMGTFYISDMLGQFSQNVPMALAAYNAGPHRLRAWLELRPEVYSLKENHSSQPVDELWFDELPWSETSFYVKAILRNILVYRLIDKSPVVFKPIFWSELTSKKTDTAGSPIVK